MCLTADQREYVAAVEAGCEGLDFISPGVCPGCDVCRSDYGFDTLADLAAAWEKGEIAEDPHFSWRPCECCGSALGGDRYDAHGVDSEGEIVHFSICVDCLCYLANGDIPEQWEG